jgi:outer membrane protein assembly factor BamB
MRIRKSKTAIILSLLFSGTLLLSGQQIGWRGPLRSGVYNETGLLKTWPAEGPKLLWEAAGFGMGHSSATVTDDAVYITGVHGNKDVLTAFTVDGKKKWELAYGTMGRSTFPESRSTPTYSNGKLFVIGGQGELTCISKDGKLVWTVNHYQKYSASVPRFGISESPLVVDNKVIATPGGKKASMVAFNVENGNVIWEAPPLNEDTQYVNPLLVETGDKKVIITHSSSFIFAVNAADGKIIWKFDFGSVNPDKESGKNYINTPIYKDGYLFAANGYGQTSAMLKVTFDGKPPVLVWKNPDINPHVGGMVLVGNYIYSSTHDNNSFGRWICVDWTTGKTMWIKEWKNKGAVISADGMIYIFEEKNGNVGLVKPSSEKLDVISSFKLPKGEGPAWAHPVIDKGRLFVRRGDYMAVYSISAK